MTDIEVHQGSSLALSSEQNYWNEAQLAALRHMGVEKATPGDLQVFHHVCTRTGLDPFARQIYMIARELSEQVNGEWQKVTKYTIQTGIDGFRLIGRRAANRSKHTISVSAPEWAHEDGSWRPVWMAAWGTPVAAKVVIKRDDEPFEAVALFDEYKQTKRNGDLTRMWAQRPAGQIAKCAEALAWRMAFPQDLSGIYTDDEMGAADYRELEQEPQEPQRRGIAAAIKAREQTDSGPIETPNTPGTIAPQQLKKLHAMLTKAGVSDREAALAYYERVTGRAVESSKDLSANEAGFVLDDLDRWERGESNTVPQLPTPDDTQENNA